MKRAILKTMKGAIIIIHVPLTYVWKNLDMKLSWPDFWPVFRNVPHKIFGGVGGDSYTGWVYQSGYFAALLKAYSKKKSANRILDFGCGYGKMAFPASSLINNGGKYVGVDIIDEVIDYGNKVYAKNGNYIFHLSKDFNLRYNKNNIETTYGLDWPIEDKEMDIVTAISVFTHLREEDAKGYINKIYNVLKKEGIAILTFHILNDKTNQPRYKTRMMPFLLDLFSFRHKLSDHWYTSDKKVPETAIGITYDGIRRLIHGKFEIKKRINGSTTGGQDLFPQDILILEKL